MGYKRMKKRKDLMVPSSMIGPFLKQHMREIRKRREKAFAELVLFGDPTPNFTGDDSERMKWFESPNAEGYLDM